MTDTTTNFDPITRLQQIAAIIKESGADIFYAPTTVAYDIECAIKEIDCLTAQVDTLRKERDQARREVCAFVSGRYSKDVVTLDRAAALDEAKMRGWDCYKEEK